MCFCTVCCSVQHCCRKSLLNPLTIEKWTLIHSQSVWEETSYKIFWKSKFCQVGNLQLFVTSGNVAKTDFIEFHMFLLEPGPLLMSMLCKQSLESLVGLSLFVNTVCLDQKEHWDDVCVSYFFNKKTDHLASFSVLSRGCNKTSFPHQTEFSMITIAEINTCSKQAHSALQFRNVGCSWTNVCKTIWVAQRCWKELLHFTRWRLVSFVWWNALKDWKGIIEMFSVFEKMGLRLSLSRSKKSGPHWERNLLCMRMIWWVSLSQLRHHFCMGLTNVVATQTQLWLSHTFEWNNVFPRFGKNCNATWSQSCQLDLDLDENEELTNIGCMFHWDILDVCHFIPNVLSCGCEWNRSKRNTIVSNENISLSTQASFSWKKFMNLFFQTPHLQFANVQICLKKKLEEAGNKLSFADAALFMQDCSKMSNNIFKTVVSCGARTFQMTENVSCNVKQCKAWSLQDWIVFPATIETASSLIVAEKERNDCSATAVSYTHLTLADE